MKKFWEVVRSIFCVIGVITVLYYGFIGFFCGPSPRRSGFGHAGGSSVAEPYDRHKMSQVVVPPPTPMWQKPRTGDNRLRRIVENLEHGLDNVPKYEWHDYEPPQPTNAVLYPWKEYRAP